MCIRDSLREEETYGAKPEGSYEQGSFLKEEEMAKQKIIGQLFDCLLYTSITKALLPIAHESELFKVSGFIGKPMISRGNRGYELYFVNGRFIRSQILSKAIEDAFKPFLMQHQYPFTVLYFEIDSSLLDVNVHPTKMELRFSNQQELYREVQSILSAALVHRDIILVSYTHLDVYKRQTHRCRCSRWRCCRIGGSHYGGTKRCKSSYFRAQRSTW